MKIPYAQFCREISGKRLALLQCSFLDGQNQKDIASSLALSWDTRAIAWQTHSIINTGIVTIRANDFYRTRDDTGEKSYASRQKGETVHKAEHDGETFFLLLSDTNVLVYKTVKE